MPEETMALAPEATGDEQQPSAMPTENQSIEEVVEAAPEELSLPDTASDRTREQFEKLKAQKRQLEEQLAEKDKQTVPKPPSVLEAFTPPVMPDQPQYGYPPQEYGHVPPQEYDQLIESSIDPRDGALDVALLRQKLSKRDQSNAEKLARDADQRAQHALQRVEQFEITQQTKNLHQVFPELDPDSTSFNPEAYDLVKNELLNQLVQTGRQDAIAAATRMSKHFRSSAPSEEQQAAQRARAVASTSVGIGTKHGYSAQEYENLRHQSRRDPAAMAERLRRNGY